MKQNNLTEQDVENIRANYLEYKDKFFDFCYNVLGYTDMNFIHKKVCGFLSEDIEPNDKKYLKLILMPRYSFKSCICTIGFSLWRLMKNTNLRILIYSDATQKSHGFLTSIKNHIEGQIPESKFRLGFEQWETDSKKGKWNEQEILISPRQAAQAENSVETAGEGTSLTGKHYDIIIFDDLVCDKNVTTKDQMDKVRRVYQEALSLLVPNGEIIVVGTRWHLGDLYGHLIAENEISRNIRTFIIDGVNDSKYGEYCFKNIGLDKGFLDSQKARQGSYCFSCLYRNNPVSAEQAIFKNENFSFYGAIKSEDLYITCTLDPAGEGNDKTGLTLVGTDNELNLNILEAIGKKMIPSEMIELVIKLNYKYKIKSFGLETIFFRRMLKREFERAIFEEHRENSDRFPLFHIEEFDSSSRHGKSKFSRIMGLQPYHERGVIKFPGERLELLKDGFGDLAHQMMHFTADHMPEPNDLLDSLADHIPLIRKGGIVKKAELPYRSPAWLERREYDKEMELRKHIPHKYRKPVGGLAYS